MACLKKVPPPIFKSLSPLWNEVMKDENAQINDFSNTPDRHISIPTWIEHTLKLVRNENYNHFVKVMCNVNIFGLLKKTNNCKMVLGGYNNWTKKVQHFVAPTQKHNGLF